ncbi:MAG: App1 family protein, partial [Candidatus Nanopelagicales bacterium]
HKTARIRRILDAYPEMSFILIGDSGERDPEIYQEFLESDPDRIELAMIRDVDAQPAEVEVETVIEGPDTASLVTVRDSIEMAVIARRLGLIDELTVEEVMTEIDARL